MPFGVNRIFGEVYEVDISKVDKELDRLVITSNRNDRLIELWFSLEDTGNIEFQLRIDRERTDQEFITALDGGLSGLKIKNPHELPVYLLTGLRFPKPRFRIPPDIQVPVGGKVFYSDTRDELGLGSGTTIESRTINKPVGRVE